MTGKADRRFWKCFEKLPAPVQKLARDRKNFGRVLLQHPDPINGVATFCRIVGLEGSVNQLARFRNIRVETHNDKRAKLF